MGALRDDEKTRERTWVGAAPEGTRPRDLRSSYVTVQVYAGVPLTKIARWCGTSVAMIDKHYAGVIASWDGKGRAGRRADRASARAAASRPGHAGDWDAVSEFTVTFRDEAGAPISPPHVRAGRHIVRTEYRHDDRALECTLATRTPTSCGCSTTRCAAAQ